MTFLGAERADPSGFRSSALGDGLDPFWRWVKEHVVHLWTGLEGARPVFGEGGWSTPKSSGGEEGASFGRLRSSRHGPHQSKEV